MVMQRLLSWTILASLLVATLQTGAARAEPDAYSQARTLFEQGIELANADRWAEALDAFRRSSELVARPSTSYNVANAYYRLNRPVDALAELDAHDRMPEVSSDAAAQARSRELRALVRAAVAEVLVSVEPPSATLFVNGWPTNLDGASRLVQLNPGTHFLQVIRDGYHPQRHELRVDRGARESLSVELVPIESAVAPETTAQSVTPVPVAASTGAGQTEDDRKPFVKRPGFWVLIGVVGAAAIGAGVAIAVTRRDDSPACGTTGDCATTQGLTVAF
jgi:hypothetical protein